MLNFSAFLASAPASRSWSCDADTLGQLLVALSGSGFRRSARSSPPTACTRRSSRTSTATRFVSDPRTRLLGQRLRADPFCRRGRLTWPRAPFGYHGCYLRIDVSNGRVERVPIAETVLRQFLGGSGLGVWLLLEEGAACADALAPEAPIAFVFSPLVGSPLTTSAKFAVVSKSPLTDRINDSLASSGFAIAGKRCGCDAIVIVGRAAALSTLIIDDGTRAAGSRRRSARRDVRGHGSRRSRRGSAPTTRSRRLDRPASAWSATRRSRTTGATPAAAGSGAVLGSKNVKAIAVRGSQRCEWAHPRELGEYSKALSKRSFGPATAKYRELGTAANLLTFNRLGVLPTRNFQSGTFDEAVSISPEEIRQTHSRTRASCVACTIGCEHIYSLGRTTERRPPGIREPLRARPALRRRRSRMSCSAPRGSATSWASTPSAPAARSPSRWSASSAGGSTSRGSRSDPARRCSAPSSRLAAATASANLLAEGSRRAAGSIGHDSIAFAPQVKGLEIPGYEPRALQTMALGFAVGARGADHNRSGAYEVDFSEQVDRKHVTVDAVHYAIETEDKAALMDSLIICKFLRGVFEDFYARGRRYAAPRDRLGCDRRRASRDRPAHRRRQAAVQPAGRLDARGRHAARSVPRNGGRRRPDGGAQPRALEPRWSPNIIVSAAGWTPTSPWYLGLGAWSVPWSLVLRPSLVPCPSSSARC